MDTIIQVISAPRGAGMTDFGVENDLLDLYRINVRDQRGQTHLQSRATYCLIRSHVGQTKE